MIQNIKLLKTDKEFRTTKILTLELSKFNEIT